MTTTKFIALTFGERACSLGDELEALGTSVVRVEDPDAVLATLDSLRDVSVLVLSSDVGRGAAALVFAAVKGRYAALPTIWLGTPLGGAPLSDFRSSPDALLHDPMSAEDVQRKVRELVQRLHTATVAGLLVDVIAEALRESYSIDPVPSPVRVNALHRLVNDVNTIVAFCGAGISGRLLVSAEEPTLLAIRARVLGSSSSAGRFEAEDLAGEIGNLAAGKLKYAFDRLDVECEIGTPLLVGRAGVILRPNRGQPSLCVEFSCEDGLVRGELAIDHCDDEQLEKLSRALEHAAPAATEELCFF